MKITAVKTFIVDGGFRPWTFVKVETSDPGLVGWGDCTDWGSPGPVAATVERYAEWVIGRDPMQAEAIWWDLSAASVRHIGGHRLEGHVGHRLGAVGHPRQSAGRAGVAAPGRQDARQLRLYWSHCGSTRASHAERLGVPRVETTDDLYTLCAEVLARGYTAIKTNMIRLKDRPVSPAAFARFSSKPAISTR